MPVGYRCTRCGYTTNHKCAAYRHLGRQIPCRVLGSRDDDHQDASIEQFHMDKQLTCRHCNKAYARRDISFRQHEFRCAASVVNINNNCNNTTNSNNTTTNNIVLNYDFSTREMITPKLMELCLRQGIRARPSIMEAIHCNPQYPQNQNVMIPNVNRADVEVYRGKAKGWRREPLHPMIDHMILMCDSMLDDFATENEDPTVDVYIENHTALLKNASRVREELKLFRMALMNVTAGVKQRRKRDR